MRSGGAAQYQLGIRNKELGMKVRCTIHIASQASYSRQLAVGRRPKAKTRFIGSKVQRFFYLSYDM